VAETATGSAVIHPIEDGVLGVDVKVDERRFRHGKPILPAGLDRMVTAIAHAA